MTSREALKTLKGYLGIDTKIIELLIPIAEDLEVLDILKANIVNCIGDTSGQEYYKLILHKFNNEENFEKVNKWLKN